MKIIMDCLQKFCAVMQRDGAHQVRMENDATSLLITTPLRLLGQL